MIVYTDIDHRTGEVVSEGVLEPLREATVRAFMAGATDSIKVEWGYVDFTRIYTEVEDE